MNFHGLTGNVITPSDKGYPFLRLEYNLAINRFPLAIVYCYTPIDVSNAMNVQCLPPTFNPTVPSVQEISYKHNMPKCIPSRSLSGDSIEYFVS